MSRSRYIFECPQPGCRKRYTRLEYVKRHAQFQHHRNFLSEQIPREVAKDPEEYNVTFTEASEPTKPLKLTWPGLEVDPILASNLPPNLAQSPVPPVQSAQLPVGQVRNTQAMRDMYGQDENRAPNRIRTDRMQDMRVQPLTQGRSQEMRQVRYDKFVYTQDVKPQDHSRSVPHQEYSHVQLPLAHNKQTQPAPSRHRSHSRPAPTQSHNQFSQPVQTTQTQHAHNMPVHNLPVQAGYSQSAQTHLENTQPVQYTQTQFAQLAQNVPIQRENTKSEPAHPPVAATSLYTSLTKAAEPADLVGEIYAQQRQEIDRLNGKIGHLHLVLAGISQLLADEVRTR